LILKEIGKYCELDGNWFDEVPGIYMAYKGMPKIDIVGKWIVSRGLGRSDKK
jgi:hypothetical protein